MIYFSIEFAKKQGSISQSINYCRMAKATFKPSTAAETIPPACPAPSPHGYRFKIGDIQIGRASWRERVCMFV